MFKDFMKGINTFQHNLLLWLYWALELIQVGIIVLVGYYVIVDLLPALVILIENSK